MVSEKLLKKKAASNRKLLTDEKFFTSPVLANYFVELALMLVHRYDDKAKIGVKLLWEPKSDITAYTDNRTIVINCAMSLVTAHKARLDRLDIVKGIFAHELAHILYTDFGVMELCHDSLYMGRWFPSKPTFSKAEYLNNLEDIQLYWKKGTEARGYFESVSHDIDNIIEDGFIEEAFMDHFKGNLAGGLYFLRDTHYDSIPFAWKLNESCELDEEDPHYLHPWLAVTQELLCYAKFGEFKVEDTEDEYDLPCIASLKPVLTDIDAALSTYDGRKRRANVNKVIIKLWPIIKDYLEYVERQPKPDPSMEGKVAGTSKPGSGSGSVSGKPVAGSKGSSASKEKDSSGLSKKREETKKKSESTKGKGKGDSDSSSTASEGSDEAKEFEDGFSSSSGKKKTKSEEGGRIKPTQTDSVYTGDGTADSTPEKEDISADSDAAYDEAAKELEDLMGKMAEETAKSDMEKAVTKALNDETRTMDMGNNHNGIPCKINRITEVTPAMVDSYNRVAPPLEAISKRMAKVVSQKLKDKRRGGKETNLYVGRRFEARALIRDDGKCFYKNKLPNQAPTIAVGICVDESGSMSCGDRATAARAAAIVLYNFCVELGVPVMVYGHTADDHRYGTVTLNSYAEFDGSYDKRDKYRLMDISARANNRDGYALQYMYEKLARRPEDTKLLFMISDGQPAASGYGGSSAEADMKAIRQKYTKKHIITFAAAIGNDKDAIERIYQEGFLDISNLNELPQTLTKMLLKYIKV